MSAKRKTVLKGFDYMHCDDFAKYLSKMAVKGWHFREWGAGLKFEQGEPEQAIYAVEVFTKASENDMRPEPHTQEFAEYCEAAGWKFVDAKQKFCIFKKIEEDAVDLFTPEERVTNAFKGMTSGYAVLLLILYGINVLLQWINIVNIFERNIFSASFLFSFSVWNMLFLGQLCRFVYAFWKKSRFTRAIKNGEDIYIGNRKDGKPHIAMKDIYVGVLVLILMVYLLMLGKLALALLYVICILVTVTFSLVIAKVRPDSNTNLGIQIGFSIIFGIILIVGTFAVFVDNYDNEVVQQDKLPLQISDYRAFTETIEDIDIYEDRNLFGSCETYYIFSEKDSVYYYIYRTEHAWILDQIWEKELDARFNEGAANCTTDWGAEKALRNKLGTYYVRYENCILVFRDNEDVYLTPEQIGIICEKLDVR